MTAPPPGVAILGAGPVGLDAALACADAGLECTVYEAGTAVGAHVAQWGHVRMFTPWSMNASPRMRAHLPGLPDDDRCPTGDELTERLLVPLAGSAALAGRVRLGHRVRAVARRGLLKHEEIGSAARASAPFRLLIDGPDGEQLRQAATVLDCTGTYGNPNRLGDGGIPALGEATVEGHITRTLPRTEDPDRWQGTVLLVGAGKSAQTAARQLARLPRTRLDWVVRDPAPDWGEVPGDVLPGRQALVDSARLFVSGGNQRVVVHTGTTVQALDRDGRRVRVRLASPAGDARLTVDHIVGLTGYVGDDGLYRQLQVHECYATAAPMNLSAALLGAGAADCLAQPAVGVDTLRSPEPNFFVLGAKSYGRLDNFLLRVGYEQVSQVGALVAEAAGA
ncbi:MAG TPA: NAD(P)-binding protein [Pseudonocardia sp.]|jgi:hypothetical protein|uniref:NAD(P)-binding protein n=1 Tax=Pseudonocardia sp. TaxID=60912 RepID=UPI002F408549